MRITRWVLVAGCAAALWLSPGGETAVGREAEQAAPNKKILVFVGTYTGGKSQGIYACELDGATGALRQLGVTSGIKNPSFLAIHPSHRFLYAVSEVDRFADASGGAVTAFSLDPATARLSELNSESSGGAGPCHLVVDREGKNVLVANYGAGSASVLPIGDDGKLKPASSRVQHRGSSINQQRQEGPHAHSINLDRDGRFAFVADLGLDQVLIYRFDPEHGKLTPNDPPYTAVAAGSGPRHFAFHPSGRFAYAINEMKSTITAFRYDAQQGKLTEVQTVSTLPADFRGENTTAEVQVHLSGKFVYGSNRGHDSIAAFVVDETSGRLTPRGHQATGGRTPRNFGIDPNGKFLLACNQDSDSIHVLRISAKDGTLEATGKHIEIPMPVCVKMMIRE